MKGWKNLFGQQRSMLGSILLNYRHVQTLFGSISICLKKGLYRLSYHFPPYCKGTKAWKHAFYFQAHKQLLTEIVQIQHSISVSQTLKQGRLIYIIISLYNIIKHQSWILLDVVSTHFLICWNKRVLDILKMFFFWNVRIFQPMDLHNKDFSFWL